MLGSEVTFFLCEELKLTLCGPKLTCFDYDRWTSFLRWRWWSKVTRFSDAGRKWLGFIVSIEIDMVFVWVVDLDLISLWWVGIDLVFV